MVPRRAAPESWGGHGLRHFGQFVRGRWTLNARLAVSWLSGCLLVISAGPPEQASASDVTAGVAHEQFVLPRGVPLAGYSRRKGRPSRGIHDPVGVRALILDDGHSTAALISADVLIVDEALYAALRRRLTAAGLPQHLTVIFAATHTHSGPGAYGRRFLEKISMGHFDPAVFEAIVQASAQAAARAYAQRGPIQVAYRTAQTEGLVVNRMERGGPADGELAVYALYRTGTGQPMSVLVGFAAHPTALGAWNTQLSADYPGVVMRELERRFPGATALFFAGAVGDQAPVKSGSGFDRAERIGNALATQAAALVEAGPPEPVESMQGLEETMALPPAHVRLRPHLALPGWIGRRLVDDDATLSMVRVGHTVFMGVPCDVASALGHELKQAARLRALQPMIIGFADDYVGYCMPESVYRSGAYEALMAFNGPVAGELIVKRLLHMLDSVAVSTGRPN